MHNYKEIRGSATSVPSNIVEGTGRNTNAQFSRFLEYSSRSANEIDTQLILANRLNFLKDEDYGLIADRIDHIQKKNRRLQQSLFKK